MNAESHMESDQINLNDYKKLLFKQTFALLGMASLFIDGIFSVKAETKREAILLPLGGSEVDSSWRIISKQANQDYSPVWYTKTDKTHDQHMVKRLVEVEVASAT